MARHVLRLYVKSEEGGEAEVSNMSSWRRGLVGQVQSHDGPEGVVHCTHRLAGAGL
jgi:hypothetical protein